MKHLITLCTLVFVFTQISFSSLSAQSTITDSGSYFVQEQVGSKFNQITFTDGDVQILFHKDRIELIGTSVERPYFFILLQNMKFEMPEGDGMIKRESVTISDESMVNVLGTSNMDKTYFNSIKYIEIGTGKEILINIKDNRLDFNALTDLPLELELWGNVGETANRDRKVQLEEFGRIIEFASKNNSIKKDENNISFQQDGGNENASLHFSLTIN